MHTPFDKSPRKEPPTTSLRYSGRSQLTEHVLFELSNLIPLNKVEPLGFELGFTYAEILKYKSTNSQGRLVTSDGTHAMLQDWFQRTSSIKDVVILRNALTKAGLTRLEEKYFK